MTRTPRQRASGVEPWAGAADTVMRIGLGALAICVLGIWAVGIMIHFVSAMIVPLIVWRSFLLWICLRACARGLHGWWLPRLGIWLSLLGFGTAVTRLLTIRADNLYDPASGFYLVSEVLGLIVLGLAGCSAIGMLSIHTKAAWLKYWSYAVVLGACATFAIDLVSGGEPNGPVIAVFFAMISGAFFLGHAGLWYTLLCSWRWLYTRKFEPPRLHVMGQVLLYLVAFPSFVIYSHTLEFINGAEFNPLEAFAQVGSKSLVPGSLAMLGALLGVIAGTCFGAYWMFSLIERTAPRKRILSKRIPKAT